MSDEALNVATKKIGKRKRSTSSSNANAVPAEVPGHVKQLKNEKAGRKGLGKKLKKYSHAPSINISTTEANNYLSNIVPIMSQTSRLDDMMERQMHGSVVPEELLRRNPLPSKVIELISKDPQLKGPMFQTVWLSMERNILFYGFGAKSNLIDGLVENYLKGEDVLAIDGNNGIQAVKALLNTITKSILGIDDKSALGYVLYAKYLTGRYSI